MKKPSQINKEKYTKPVIKSSNIKPITFYGSNTFRNIADTEMYIGLAISY